MFRTFRLFAAACMITCCAPHQMGQVPKSAVRVQMAPEKRIELPYTDAFPTPTDAQDPFPPMGFADGILGIHATNYTVISGATPSPDGTALDLKAETEPVWAQYFLPLWFVQRPTLGLDWEVLAHDLDSDSVFVVVEVGGKDSVWYAAPEDGILTLNLSHPRPPFTKVRVGILVLPGSHVRLSWILTGPAERRGTGDAGEPSGGGLGARTFRTEFGPPPPLPPPIALSGNAPSDGAARYCPKVSDQGHQPSCTAHATVGSLQCRADAVALLAELESEPSVAALYDRSGSDQGFPLEESCQEGRYLRQALDLVRREGVPTNKTAPSRRVRCGTYRSFRSDTPNWHLQGPPRQLPSEDIVETIVSELGAGRAVPFGMSVPVGGFGITPRRFLFGAFPPPPRPTGGHAMTFVAYDDHRKRFLVRNSWGSDWGNKGHMYLPYSFVRWAARSDSSYRFDVYSLESAMDHGEHSRIEDRIVSAPMECAVTTEARVYFHTDKWNIELDEVRDPLAGNDRALLESADRIKRCLDAGANTTVEVIGATDKTGTDQYNHDL